MTRDILRKRLITMPTLFLMALALCLLGGFAGCTSSTSDSGGTAAALTNGQDDDGDGKIDEGKDDDGDGEADEAAAAEAEDDEADENEADENEADDDGNEADDEGAEADEEAEG